MISKWETGVCLPDAANLLALSRFFGVSTDALLKGNFIHTDSRTAEVPLSLLTDTVFAEPEAEGGSGRQSLVPPPSDTVTGNYLCSWYAQQLIAKRLGLTKNRYAELRDTLTAGMLFDDSSEFHPLSREYRKGLIFLVDDGWDVPFGTPSDPANWRRFGSLLPDTERFAALGKTEESRLRGLSEKMKKLGYAGLILFIDECIDLYKIPNRISREANYEKILTIFNDTMQGRASSLGVIFGGTPQFLEDTRRGLFSYEALRSRLADSRYAELGYRDLSSPVIRLRRLSDNELLALIRRLTKLYMQREETETPPLSDEEIERFLQISASRAGAEELLMPRELIRDYLSLLNILRDNKDLHFDDVMKDFEARPTQNFSNSESENDTKNDKKQKISLFDLEF